jgi:hypothetical protein
MKFCQGFLVAALLALALFWMPIYALAGEKVLTFAWEQPGDISDLKGWNIYIGEASGNYTQKLFIPYGGTPAPEYQSAQPIGSPDGQKKTWFFVLTALDIDGNESTYSNEVSAKIDFQAPGIPVNVRVTVRPVP